MGSHEYPGMSAKKRTSKEPQKVPMQYQGGQSNGPLSQDPDKIKSGG